MLRSLFLFLAAVAVPGFGAVLYDGALGTAPGSQGYLFAALGGTQAIGASGTTLDTTGSDLFRAGYSRVDQTHDRSAGYTYTFDLQILGEDHSNTGAQNNTGTDNIADRAGVSITVLGGDLLGIELGFWLDEIWAQNDGAVKADPTAAPTGTRFTHGEGAAVNTGSMTRYNLSVVGSSYALYAAGNLVLSGALRDYSNEGAPYNLSNFFFLGDNTTSARGSFLINRIELAASAIPEPATLGVTTVLLSVGLLLARRPRR